MRVPHHIRPAGATRLPRSHAFIDVETQTHPTLRRGVQTWRLAAGEHVTGHVSRGWGKPEAIDYLTPLSLWSDVVWRIPEAGRLVWWSHNLSFDLRASAAFEWLPGLGFELEAIALDHNAGWARWTRDDQTLLMVDSLSWLPAPLRAIAGDLGMQQPDHPPADAPAEAWLARCRCDVAILRAAVLRCLTMVEAGDLGPWSPTGPGQSHSAWRRRFLSCRPLVHDHTRVIELERRAAWTGRCEAWRHGVLAGGPFIEYDLDAAYCEIAAGCELPRMLVGPIEEHAAVKRAVEVDRYAILARVRVRCREAVLPTLHRDQIVWPVGTFETVLWDPELRLAIEAGCNVEYLESYAYRRGPVLRDVAAWILRELEDASLVGDGIRRRLLKHWARALIGRCGMRYRSWEPWGRAHEPDVTMGFILDYETGVERELLQVGHELKVLTDYEESRDSLPQIPGWVMSECRVRLWRLMQTAGLSHVVYVDTDSIIVDRAGAERIAEAETAGLLPPLHVKGRYSRMKVDGPRMLDVDHERRRSGIPLSAGIQDGTRLSGEVHRSLKRALMDRGISTVEIVERTFEPSALDIRRVHGCNGETSAVYLEQ